MATYYSARTGVTSTWVRSGYQHISIRDRQLQSSDEDIKTHCIQELLKIPDLPNILNLEKTVIEAIAYFRKDGTTETVGSALSAIIERNNQ